MHSDVDPVRGAAAAGPPLGPLRRDGLGRRQRALLAGRGRRPSARCDAGALYPPIAANLTMLCFQQTVPGRDDPDPAAPACATASRRRRRRARHDRRGRRALREARPRVRRHRGDDRHRRPTATPLWTSEVTFTPGRDAGARHDRTSRAARRSPRSSCARTRGAATSTPTRRPRPRSGCPASSRRACRSRGPRTALLLDAWGEDFLAHGEIELRFVGMVLAGTTIEAARRRSTATTRRSRSRT